MNEMRQYTPDEQRVCDYLKKIAPSIGCGDDPIGFLIASHAVLSMDRRKPVDDGERLLAAEAALTELTDQCAGSCYWGEKCLCHRLWPAIEAIRGMRSDE